MQRTLNKSPKNRGFIPSEACEGGRRDLTVFGVVDETTTMKFASRACAVHCISLPVVVDKVVVVVLKFPNDVKRTSKRRRILKLLTKMVLNFLNFSTLSQFFIVKLFNKSLLLQIIH